LKIRKNTNNIENIKYIKKNIIGLKFPQIANNWYRKFRISSHRYYWYW